MKRILLLTIFICFACIVKADTGFVFKGTIGKYPIVMEIWATASSISGSYYYVSQGKRNSISLTGTSEPDTINNWIITEEILGMFNGFFRIYWTRWQDNDEYKNITGEYINIKGKHFPVKLRCVKIMSNPEHC